jgi:hypothetical protein
MRLLTGLDCAVGVLGESERRKRGVRRLALEGAKGGPMMGDPLPALVVAGLVRNQFL